MRRASTWQRLEEPFAEFMYQMANEASGDETALDAWTERVRDAATVTFRGIVKPLGDSVAAIKASSLVTPVFYSMLHAVGGAET